MELCKRPAFRLTNGWQSKAVWVPTTGEGGGNNHPYCINTRYLSQHTGYSANNNAIMAKQTWPVITNEITFLWILLLNTATTINNITTTTNGYEN